MVATLVVRQSSILGLAVLAIATVEQPLTVPIAKTAGNNDSHLSLTNHRYSKIKELGDIELQFL